MPSSSPTEAFKALGNPHRVQILDRFVGRPGRRPAAKALTSSEIAEELPIDHSTVCYHLRVMIDAELLERSNRGARTTYRLRTDRRADLQAVLARS